MDEPLDLERRVPFRPQRSELEAEIRRLRAQVTGLWARHLELLMEQTLDDGTPVLQIVFGLDPSLRDRLLAALRTPIV